MKLLLLVLLLLVAIPAFTQQDSVKITTPGDTVVVTETWTVRQLKQFARQQRRDSIRAHKKVWLSILGGPSYRWLCLFVDRFNVTHVAVSDTDANAAAAPRPD